jgi:hypothetical protein
MCSNHHTSPFHKSHKFYFSNFERNLFVSSTMITYTSNDTRCFLREDMRSTTLSLCSPVWYIDIISASRSKEGNDKHEGAVVPSL